MDLTKEMYDNLPLSKYPDDYDATKKIIEKALKDFDEYAEKIDKQFANKDKPCDSLVKIK